jgi:N6-adenosine-specific RNA methylase IME4
MQELKAHELADFYPMQDAARFAELVEGMKKSGYRDEFPIVLYEGKILDGRNRYKAATEANVKPYMVQFSGDDPVDFVVQANSNRRDLEAGQRYAIFKEIMKSKYAAQGKKNMSAGGGDKTSTAAKSGFIKFDKPAPVNTQKEIAKAAGVSTGTAAMVDFVEKRSPELYGKIASGEINVNKAYREVKQVETREERKSQQIPDGKYTLIYADPPWRYDFAQSESREIENQYPTMEIDDICKLPINNLAAENCILFLWGTNPKLREALRVVEAWGFEYKTNMVWVKDKIGMGYYARQKHEFLLIATKGNPGTPEPKDRPESVIFADREKHSKKPLEVYDMLEAMYPDAKRIELFSRLAREGWSAWGNE